MVITECVLHGFKGFAEPITLHLKPGLNLVTGGNESGKSTLCEGILAALFASPSSSAFLNWSKPGVCRILLFFSTPRGRFRCVKDFVRHSTDLSVWNNAKAAFLPTARDPSHVAAFLSNEFGGVNEAVYRTLYVLQPPPRYSIPLAAEPAPASQSSSKAISPGESRQEQKDRLQQLKGYLESYRQIRETELLLDSLRAQYDETHASLQSLATLEEERRTIRETLERLQPLASLATSSLLPQITEYQKALETRNGEARELEERIEEERARLVLVPPTPLLRHRLFLIGAGLLILSFVAGQFVPFVDAGIFIGLGCMAAALIQYLRWNQNRGKVRKGLLVLEHQLYRAS